MAEIPEGVDNNNDVAGSAASNSGNDDDNNNNNNNKRKKSCPYLDSIDRTALDFDLEQACSVTLQTGSHIYACLVCGAYLRGRGPRTPAYTHSVQRGHYVFCHLASGAFYCLPDEYEIEDSSLRDIQRALHPIFATESIPTLGMTLSRDLFGRLYRPGFVGLQNLQGTDHLNASIQALAHVVPLRDYFLADQYHVSHKHKTAYIVTTSFADVVRKLWSPYRFRSHVDPHVFVHVVPKEKRDVGDFIAWLLHQLHLGTKMKKNQKSIIERAFQGHVKVTTRETQRVRNDANRNGNDDDERYGSDDDNDDDDKNGHDDDDDNGTHQEDGQHAGDQTLVAETVTETTFLSLSVDIPEKPLFRDEEGGLVIPQEALSNALQKFDGQRFVDNTRKAKGGKAQRRRYQIQTLPDHLILHLTRFRDKEKNPTIIVFPVKNLDLQQYVIGGDKSPPPTQEEIRAMGIGELKRCIEQYGGGGPRRAYHVVEKKDLIEAAVDATSYKYDLVANIAHDSPVEVGREDGGKIDQLHEGTYKCNVKSDKQWFEIQDLHVKEVMPQQIGVSESCVLIFARRRSSGATSFTSS